MDGWINGWVDGWVDGAGSSLAQALLWARLFSGPGSSLGLHAQLLSLISHVFIFAHWGELFSSQVQLEP